MKIERDKKTFKNVSVVAKDKSNLKVKCRRVYVVEYKSNVTYSEMVQVFGAKR